MVDTYCPALVCLEDAGTNNQPTKGDARNAGSLSQILHGLGFAKTQHSAQSETGRVQGLSKAGDT
ncbi:hypothetical protein GCM10023185_36640 [Hymenobacter saemangeumensis]|uniref:Transposase IS111A/IS1328/IS1533 N-terminal domain-containing protein n=1 Tax=Hymenobacter saemangeumensis TaxID=1084522 RepID=A0ABP8IPZ0_9BACT